MPSGEVNGGVSPGALNASKLGTITYPGGGSSASGTFTVPPWANAIAMLGGNAGADASYAVQGTTTNQFYGQSPLCRGGLFCVPVLPGIDPQVICSSTPLDAGSGTIQIIALSEVMPPTLLFDRAHLMDTGVKVSGHPHLLGVDTPFYFLDSPAAANGTDTTIDVSAPLAGQVLTVDHLHLEVDATPAIGSTVGYFTVTNAANGELARVGEIGQAGPVLSTYDQAVHFSVANPNKLRYRRANTTGAAVTFTVSAIGRIYTL